MSVVIELEGVLAAHVAAALARWSQECRVQQVRLPDGFADLLALATRRAHTRPGAPLVDEVEVLADARPVAPLMVTKGDAARVLALSPRTVDRLVAGGSLPAVKVGDATRVRVADLEAYVEALNASPSGGIVRESAAAQS